jgi:hypothetical protein
MDFQAVADAIALRLDQDHITPPTDQEAIKLSTARLPASIKNEPVVLVLPPTIAFNLPSARLHTGSATYPVRFYLNAYARNQEWNTALLHSWPSQFYTAFDAQADFQLGLDTYVTGTYISSSTPGTIRYGGKPYYGLAMTVVVNFSEVIA